jgi:hypothetical protein
MKFECKKCMDEGLCNHPCKLVLKDIKDLNYERDDWNVALRRCPFEDSKSGELTGNAPLAKWKRVKK